MERRSFLIAALASAITMPAAAQTILAREPEIIQAIQAGDLAGVKVLIIRGENPTVTDFDGLNGIAIAARNGDYDMIDYLLQLEVSINWQDKIGNTALHWVTIDGDMDMAAYLMDNGSDQNVANGRGLTPLMVAAREGFLDLVELFIDRNPDFGLRDYTGRSALDWARDSRTPGVEDALIRGGAQ